MEVQASNRDTSVLNEIELTILTLTAEGPRYGSEIEQLITDRGLRQWLTVGSSSVYYVLDRLEQQALIASQLDGSAKRVYQLTDAGRGVLQTALANLLAQPRPAAGGVELALANLNALKPAQVYQVMQQRQTALRQQLQIAEQRRDAHKQEAEGADEMGALYSYSLTLMRAELQWLDEFLQDWRCRYPAAASKSDDRNATRITRGTGPLHPAKKVQRLPRLPKTE